MFLHKLSSRLVPVCGSVPVHKCIATSSVKLVRKLVVEETDTVTVVKGVEVESDRKEALIHTSEPTKACPLCRLNLKNLNYSDTMITGQFLNANGKVMSLEETKLCKSQYNLITRLIYQAQQCLLLPRPDDWPKAAGTYDKLNSYFMYPYKKRDDPWTQVQEQYWE